MSISIVLLLIGTLQPYASTSHSQDSKVNIHVENASLADIFREIEKQSDYRFFYNYATVNTGKNYSLNTEKAAISEILNDLFKGTNIHYQIVEKYIVVMDKNERTENLLSSAVRQTVQQRFTVSGVVRDASGELLPGVNVSVKGISTGTVTDMNGRYSIFVTDTESVLVFSFLGMKTQEITVKNNTVIDVQLEEDVFSLEEVVTLGYTTAKKRDMIGSIAKISTEIIATPSYSNITAALQGKASGLYVSGSTVRIRGVNSISLSAEPLWIIDGVPGNGSDLNPNDIESISILKDASATALYGSSGANGVIVITTKSAIGQKSSIHVELDGGVSNFIGTGWKTMNTRDFINLYDQALANAAKYTGTMPSLYNPSEAYTWNGKLAAYVMTREEALTKSHNGIDDYTRQGQYMQAHLNSTRGFEKGNALFSLTYRNDRDVLIGGGADKLLARTSFNFSPVNYVSFNFTSINHFRASDDNTAGSTLIRSPFMPIWDEGSATGYWGPGENPIIRGDGKYRQTRTKNFSSTNYLRADVDLPFLEGLRISGVGSANFSASRWTNWSHKELMDKMADGEYTNRADDNTGFDYSSMARGEISFNRTLGDHTINALALVEGKKYYSLPVNVTGYNLNGTYPMLGTPGNIESATANRTENGNLAYIGRIAYNYKNKYLVEGNIRKDGLSTLSKKNQWATFPSIGIGWVLSDESFWKIQVINLLKLRGSIGKTGNAAVPAFSYLPGFRINFPNGATYGEYMFTSIANIASDIKWETSDNTDVGIDFGLLGNRISGSIAYYNKETSGLLLSVPLPPSAGMLVEGAGGANSVWMNVGNMRNSGIEMNVDANVIHTRDFSWNLSCNYTWSKNKVLSLEPSVDLTGQGIFGTFNSTTLTKSGGELATYYVSDFAGIDPQKGIPMIWERDATIYAETGATVRTGKQIPATRSNCDNNRFYMDGKSYQPSYYGGLRNTFRYKSIDLAWMVSYTGGHYYFDQVEWRLQYVHIGENALAADLAENSWKQPGDQAKYQELIYNGGFYYDNEGNPTATLSPGPNNDYPNTSQFLKKADNIQLKEVTLGYNFPKAISGKWGMDNLRVYFNINNALYWTKDQHNGTPDVTINSNNVDGVIRYESFMTRTFSLGLSIKF
ncbi:MAG: SusC/RagA family TonB-linked outer membrane protein [Tannerella sp.]|nr:SusC/RagA family TonB-linked outer membrane protein [Tannerella sp.]